MISAKPLKLIISLLIPQLAGWIGAIFTTPSIASWYASINQPNLTPPNWIFAPVWTILYLLMGVAFYLVWTKSQGPIEWSRGRLKRTAFIVFFGQLALNTAWSIIFFGRHQIGVALVEILLLWVVILPNIIFFYRVRRLAGLLLVPYLLWVSFAIYLNAAIWTLNR
ncbi:MAG: hypothetical protein A3D53_00285 [Candidatus Magasanikbacteria bacterium RIFCSPHIGHO2_02_FULL_45_10]|uniref:TspO protein n=1 Tax=Candidatus Magasanikbacteria bacterium RIFCSPHIGHO2_02_FULL_45_10 TaxID=1798679 RepID=A0A1F6MAH9_9BACT|nr:MAG: hypothetical protein A3D53_00285 [Candidatus Magasanikbacteria bacterium RIFCSPHIGHO2_02_FULL_45_10]